MNYIGNYLKRGGPSYAYTDAYAANSYFHGSDNVRPGGGQLFHVPSTAIIDEPWDALPVRTDTAQVAFGKMLKYGGADTIYSRKQ